MKGEEPKRFKLILLLFPTETGKSAREIANFLYHTDGIDKNKQALVKREINNINTLFKKKTRTTEELIISPKNKGKNIYSLNRRQFNFEKEK